MLTKRSAQVVVDWWRDFDLRKGKSSQRLYEPAQLRWSGGWRDPGRSSRGGSDLRTTEPSGGSDFSMRSGVVMPRVRSGEEMTESD